MSLHTSDEQATEKSPSQFLRGCMWLLFPEKWTRTMIAYYVIVLPAVFILALAMYIPSANDRRLEVGVTSFQDKVLTQSLISVMSFGDIPNTHIELAIEDGNSFKIEAVPDPTEIVFSPPLLSGPQDVTYQKKEGYSSHVALDLPEEWRQSWVITGSGAKLTITSDKPVTVSFAPTLLGQTVNTLLGIGLGIFTVLVLMVMGRLSRN